MSEENLVVVYGAETAVESMLYRTMLEEAGIDVEEQLLEVEGIGGVTQDWLHSRLLVRPEDEARARELIEEFHEEAQAGELAEETPDGGAEGTGSA